MPKEEPGSKKKKRPNGYRIPKSFRRMFFRKKMVTARPRSLGGHR